MKWNWNSSLNGSASSFQDNTGRPFSASFSTQSGALSPVFYQSGSVQGLHNLHGSFNVAGTLGSRNPTTANVPSNGLQQQSGNLSAGRFTSNNMPAALSQIAHGNSLSHSGLNSRGSLSVVGTPGFSSGANAFSGSIPGVLPTTVPISNRNSIPGVGVPPVSGNLSSRITSSAGNIGSGGSNGRSLSSGGGLSIPGLASRLNLNTSGSGNLGVQGSNRLMGGMLQQASPHVMSMFGNSYHSGGPLSQNHVQNSMGMLNDLNNNDGSPFDINDFPQLSSRPSSSGGAQGQFGSLRKQGLTVSPIVQQNQEFSIQNEDFPALPGFKVVFSGFQGSHSSYHSQGAGSLNSPGVGLRPLNSPNTVSSVGSYDQLIQQYQQQQTQSQFRLQQVFSSSQSFKDLGVKSMQVSQTAPDRFGLLGILSVIRMSDPDLTSLALGIGLTTLGLNLNSSENLHRTFGSPWLDEPSKEPPEFTVPQCYYAKQPPVLLFTRLTHLICCRYNRGWFYHREPTL
ncbi:putative CCR4-NOT complex subunit/5 domain superfamily protein [Helianthus annuus]|nr:putative CCR4-NOT complex subunit/5 domain superfamily protein [Helianthus annuus]KAJ0583362.1 putative CCR4-NOT complex subunit/5 domain superfamily protein [Helianthus annuus]KAJ0746098.1 putative CCR4-NOT complex subunit/5 domain superfamily protein [Helianthus annuus]